MPTTRQRVNLTLTEMEERLLRAISDSESAEGAAFARHLHARGLRADVSQIPLADALHAVLAIGIERLQHEGAEVSYAAEAAALTETDRRATAARRRRFAAAAAEKET